MEHNVEFFVMKHINPQLAYQTPIAFSVIYNGTCVKLCQVTCNACVTDALDLFTRLNEHASLNSPRTSAESASACDCSLRLQ